MTPTLKKPDAVSNQAFTAAKNEALAMAYGGLGLVYLRRGNLAKAIPDLEQAVQLDPEKDPTNLYLLGVANQNSAHYAYACGLQQCAEATGNLRATCKRAADDG